MSMKMHYVLELWEPAAPAFVSLTKIYVGEKPDLLHVADALEQEKPGSETAQAIYAFFVGNRQATHHIAHRELPVLTPVRVLSSSQMKLPAKTWEHINASNCPYKMRISSAEVSQIVIRYAGKYHRCVKASLTDLCYEGINGDWKSLGSTIWGNACVIDFNPQEDGQQTFGNTFYVEEETADDKDILIKRLDDPDAVILDRLCDEVFGDG